MKFEGDFVIQDLENLSDEYTTDGVAATATVTFTGVPTNGQKITIISTDGTSKEYEKAGSTSAEDLEFGGGSVGALATGLKTCIEHAEGHNGKITVSVDGGVVSLTQVTEGLAGDRAITENLSNATATNFTGGKNAPPPPLSLSVKGPPSLRRQLDVGGSIPYVVSNGGPALDLVEPTEEAD